MRLAVKEIQNLLIGAKLVCRMASDKEPKKEHVYVQKEVIKELEQVIKEYELTQKGRC